MKAIRPKKTRIGFKLFCLLIGGILSTTLLTSRAYAVLPPRPTVQSPHAKTTPTPPRVASIVLHTNPAQKGLWSVVQWKDAQGNWRDVENWRGALINGQTIW